MIATDNYSWSLLLVITSWEYIVERMYSQLAEPDFWAAWESLGHVVRALCKAKMMSRAGLEEKRDGMVGLSH